MAPRRKSAAKQQKRSQYTPSSHDATAHVASGRDSAVVVHTASAISSAPAGATSAGSAATGPAPTGPAPTGLGSTGAEPAGAALPGSVTALSVSEFTAGISALLANEVGVVHVRGEISGLSRPASGHWYFTLKDASACIRAVMFRMANRSAPFQPAEGQQVVVTARATLYEARGDFQLLVERVEAAGEGDLFARFIALKSRLEAEGLFDAALRRPLPLRIRHVGVVTSLGAAALHDVLSTLRARDAGVGVTIYPSLVQGSGAVDTLVSAIAAAQRHARADVLLLVRGGGSIDDLWSFNDERLARAVRASPIPVVTGVGHETDFTIADFAADLRALTPTAAAVAVTADRQARQQRLVRLAATLTASMQRNAGALGQRLDHASVRLQSPRQWFDRREIALRALEKALQRQANRRAEVARLWFDPVAERLRAPSITAALATLAALERHLAAARTRPSRDATQHLDRAAAALNLVDPAAVIRRGYALVRTASGSIVRSAVNLQPNQSVHVTVADGAFEACVSGIEGTVRPEQALSPDASPKRGESPIPIETRDRRRRPTPEDS